MDQNAPDDSLPPKSPTPAHLAPPPSGWKQFDGKPVAVQLRSPWLLVDENYCPVPINDRPDEGLRGTTIFRGILQVFPDILLLTVPRPDGEATFTVSIHPDDIEHCTHITVVNKPRIAQP